MALTLPVSGPYLGTYDALPLGVQNDDGFVLGVRLPAQEMDETDAWGMTLVEAIYRGQNWTLRLRGLEWSKTGLLYALQIFGSLKIDGAGLAPVLGPIGDVYSTYALALILTSILARAPSTPLTLTASQAIIAPNSDSESMFTSKIREMPLSFVLLPYVLSNSVNEVVPFTTT